jgi:hypothetical protein
VIAGMKRERRAGVSFLEQQGRRLQNFKRRH